MCLVRSMCCECLPFCISGLRSGLLRGARLLGPERPPPGAVLPAHLLQGALAAAAGGQGRGGLRRSVRRRLGGQVPEEVVEPAGESELVVRRKSTDRKTINNSLLIDVNFQIVAVASCLFVVASTLSLIFSTLPMFQINVDNNFVSRLLCRN